MWEYWIREVYTNIRDGLTCALLIVMAKLNLIGNCFCLNLNGSVMSSDGDIGIWGIKILLSACCPFTISQSIALSANSLTIKWVPLHSPLWGSMLRRSIREQSISSYKDDPHSRSLIAISLIPHWATSPFLFQPFDLGTNYILTIRSGISTVLHFLSLKWFHFSY